MAKAANIKGLDCDAHALDGVRRVLQTRLDEMCALRESALNSDDIEGVHDMRVASRRLRSALRDFAPYLGKEIPQKRLRAIAASLGAVRDEDVAIAALVRLAEDAPERTIAEGLEQLISARRERRSHAYAELQIAISADVINRFQEKFIALLERATKIRRDKKVSTRDVNREAFTFRQLGREVILARFSELQNLSGSLYRPFETEPLHRMRIAGKRLRYAMESCAPCWGERLDAFSEGVAGLQDSLGGLHDCDVWIDDVGEMLETDGTERSAAAWLLGHFTKERTKHFRNALARWREWEEADLSANLSSMLELRDSASEAQSLPALAKEEETAGPKETGDGA